MIVNNALCPHDHQKLTPTSSTSGTYLPLNDARELARQHNVLDRLHPIFDFQPGAVTPPPAPRHASKPKQPKKPAGLLQTGGVKRRKKGQHLVRLSSCHTY